MWRRGIQRLLTQGDNTLAFTMEECQSGYAKLPFYGFMASLMDGLVELYLPLWKEEHHTRIKEDAMTQRTRQMPQGWISLMHTSSLPQYTRHYLCHDNSHRRYLSPELSITKMYELYHEFCTGNSHTPVTEWVYQKQFNENHNLSFGRLVAMYTITLTLIFFDSGAIMHCTVTLTLIFSYSVVPGQTLAKRVTARWKLMLKRTQLSKPN